MDEVAKKIEFKTLTEFVPFSADEHKIHAVLASHMKNEKCYMYVVEKDGKRVLFGSNYQKNFSFIQ